ncbi:hypothetical protein BDZ94DRAFT_1287709 [Collybia nuda]|uniref:Uncharacterized protein n=1 Tax=Collybia nuda TaxID=64659 RepID=A0A9P5YEM6_9AGAR|nr:hypothetical protein BDZ94DRAFT_1287709 [Collybia nuda]
MFDAGDLDLPEFLDPALSYLADRLPSPLYSFLINVLSHFLALFTSLFTLITSLLSTSTSTWDAQTLLPPLISIFAAYLALLSLYRTTSWMIRTIIFFMKWGAMLGVFMALVGWVIGNSGGNGLENYGVVSTLGGFVLDIINGQGQNAARSSRSKTSSRKTRLRSSPIEKKKPKPKPWDSFERHHEWQQQGPAPVDHAPDAQKIISDIVDAAGRKVSATGWWNIAKKIVESGSGNEEKTEGQGPAKKSTKGRTRSR